MLFLDSHGKPVWLIVKGDTEIENYKIIAGDQDADEEIIQAFSKRKVFPFFFSDEDYQNPVSDWDSFLHETHPLPGVDGYYYANYEGHLRNNLIRENIATYNDYKKMR